ncbi:MULTISPECIES: flagellar basal body rod protein FlgB [unclassified Photobacterium]|uniref:flagellar basal body rod protein FlgB n=1 Tax=unclassified Photobacterium TaxID=2628852 RepID=UPI000D151E19|nr:MULTISPECIES: flagellar basal body rod protein FlgB [unclassified Photobacterium]PSV26203.1 flagellar basal body rod protein FlgB [Photobacterium sp. GB-56]PSV30760.1 flagellar basal body rod protein FlgB [Photobacterium sp. GB-72]PSV38257.1 flagellar basal body rod protein FlgB [Photobacterium sp. GB-27]PSV45045.1 flagellar basal body rod protein FlgB [Photobacterium sp. GB-36]PSV52206.1 flagellar basal body rod protein FlgB [Photobacterium sp. GB-1]
MAISFENALGVHPQTLDFRVQRAKVLASNLANVDTPGYLAKDIRFDAIVSQMGFGKVQKAPTQLVVSDGYAVPYQNSKDGNTVELSVEQAKFTKNNMDFQSSLTFMNMKFKGLAAVIKGR